MSGMRRREFLRPARRRSGRVAAHRSRAAGVAVIGLLSGFSPAGGAESLAAFRQGLSEAGFTEHQNIGIEYLGGRPLRAVTGDGS